MFVGLLSLQTTRISTASTDTTMDAGGGIMDGQNAANSGRAEGDGMYLLIQLM
jgi:hypothetical protein